MNILKLTNLLLALPHYYRHQYYALLIALIFVFQQVNANQNSLKDFGYLSADQILHDYRENFTEAIGNVELITEHYSLKADKALVDFAAKRIWAMGNVQATDLRNRSIITDSLFLDTSIDQAQINNFSLMIPLLIC